MDYQVKVRVRNGRIVQKMRERGFDKLIDLVRHIDCSEVGGGTYTTLSDLISMKITPVTQAGNWRPIVMKLCQALDCLPDELFNEQQMTTPIRKNTGEAFMDWPQIETLIGSGGIDAVEARQTVNKLLATLRPRLQTAVRMRMEGATYSEIGSELGVCVERARAIELRAMLDLRKAAKPRLKIAA